MAALVSSPEEVPDSSLSHMVGEVMRRFGSSGSGFFVDRARGLRGEALLRTLGDVEDEAEPLLLLGTAFSFVHLLDEMSRSGVRYALPLGSRIMETGGFKGRSRVVHRAELYESLSDRLGVPEARIVSEYGMTELLSQFYEPVLRGGGRHHVSPPWVRTRVLDPASLDPVPRGEVGVLCHFDLANLGSVCAVLTEDLGVEDADGFRLLGREEGSEPRGCSMALDELLSLTRP